MAVSAATAQSNAVLRKQAKISEMQKDWYAATQYYQRLCENDTTNLAWLYSYAEASRQIFDVDIALKSYLKLAAKDNGRKFPLTFYYIAQLYKNKELYKPAQLWFVKFGKLKINDRRTLKYNISYYRQKAKLEEEACEDALIGLKFPTAVKPSQLEATVNTKQSEFAPFERDSVLYFSTARMPERKYTSEEELRAEAAKPVYSKVYKSEIRKDKYKKIKALDTTVNSNVYHAANVTFSEDGKLMIFSRCSPINASENTCALYQTKLVKSKWTVAEKIDSIVNQRGYSFTQPFLTKQGNKSVLYFSSNRPGGQGGLDIWYCEKYDNGSFSDPVNAGSEINSKEDEVSPWFNSKDSTLYFSSSYHKGFGAFDIFKSKQKGNNFSKPVNLGYPINTGQNDLYYSQNSAGNHVYLSSNRTGSMFEGNKINCCSDIYRFTVDTTVPRLPAIDSTGIVKEKMRLLVPLTLYFHNDEPEPRTTVTVTAKSYDSTYVAYKRLVPNYLTEYSINLKGDEKQRALDMINNFFTDSLEGGLDQLEKFTRLLKDVLEKGETVKITMKGYCSPLASTNYNVNLAKRRISSLRNYFMQVNNGAFQHYVNNDTPGKGKIIFEDVDIGELPVSRASDNFKDKRNSVYSPFAASERKIQIIAISFGAN